MGLRGWIFRWRMRIQIGLILFLRYINPWSSMFRNPIAFDIWELAMNSEAIAEMMDQELIGPEDHDGPEADLLTDEDDPELADVLAAAGSVSSNRTGPGGPIRVNPRAVNAHVQRWRNVDRTRTRITSCDERRKADPKKSRINATVKLQPTNVDDHTNRTN